MEKTVVAKQMYLRGSLEKVQGVLVTREGKHEIPFSGTIGFKATLSPRGTYTLALDRLNLVAKGVKTAKGNSGVIGLSLAAPQFETRHNLRTGAISSNFMSTLHYELIDKVKGYRNVEKVKGEMDAFIPFTETMKGAFKGNFPQNMKLDEKAKITISGDMQMDLSSSVLGLFDKLTIKFGKIVVELAKISVETLKIQPVFIGTGPADPHATGKAFDTLRARSNELWGKCGSVRCLKFVYNEPVYINNNAYKVLDSSTEADNLRAEVDVTDAIEIFVAEKMSTSLTCAWGGGATFSSGTASSKIVTSDEQLNVPCPCPASCATYCPLGPCSCGALNNYHLAHELGHVINLDHPSGAYGMAPSTATSVMEPSGFCNDNPDIQSAKNCRNASNPLFYWGKTMIYRCIGSPDIND
ncbi:MAG: hypothetical protein HXX11_06480 [Desulfuromonadales bacterium]|nr:hypothetical protein [Desulfuromonadales bacterium]